MKIGVVIPTYQEQKSIKKIFYSFQRIKNIKFFFCFVDGSYSNQTSNEIKKYFKKNYKILYQKKRKKIGFFKLSSRCEASFIGFKWILKNKKVNMITDMDADLSSDPKDIKKAIKIYKKYKSDLIIGSKYLEKSKVINRSFSRSLFSNIYTTTCKLLITNEISDFSAGYRFFKSETLKKMVKQKLIFKSPAQHLANILYYYENNYIISEFPAYYADTKQNSKSISLSHIFVYVIQLTYILLKFYFRKIKNFV